MRACHKAFFKHIEPGRYRSVLALNGELPDRDFFTQCSLPVIAADGAVNALGLIKIKPKAVVGDLDAAKPELLSGLEVVHIHDQNKCDFEKTLEHMDKQNLLPTIVVGVSGGYIDHILNNIHVFLSGSNILYAPPIVGHIIKEGEERTFSLPLDTKISLFGMPETKTSSKGLKWELEHSTLTFPTSTSAFNRTNEDAISIEVHKGTLLALIYLEAINDCGNKAPIR